MLLVAEGRASCASSVFQSRGLRLKIILSVETAPNTMVASAHSIASSKGWRKDGVPSPYVRVRTGVMRGTITRDGPRPVGLVSILHFLGVGPWDHWDCKKVSWPDLDGGFLQFRLAAAPAGAFAPRFDPPDQIAPSAPSLTPSVSLRDPPPPRFARRRKESGACLVDSGLPKRKCPALGRAF